MKKLILISCLFLLTVSVVNAQTKDFPKLTGSYLGQKQPVSIGDSISKGNCQDNRTLKWQEEIDYLINGWK